MLEKIKKKISEMSSKKVDADAYKQALIADSKTPKKKVPIETRKARVIAVAAAKIAKGLPVNINDEEIIALGLQGVVLEMCRKNDARLKLARLHKLDEEEEPGGLNAVLKNTYDF